MTDTCTTVQPDSYLTLHYSLADLEGNEYVSTFDMSPATLQMGGGQLVATLEHCLLGLSTGGRHLFEIEASDAFGEHNPRLVERISRSALPADLDLKENSLIEFEAPDGGVPGVPNGIAGYLRELTDTTALFDFNHPLAGKPIRFEVEIIGIM